MKPTSIEQSILDIIPQLTFRDILVKFSLYFPISFLLVFSVVTFILQIEYKQTLAVQSKEQINKLQLVDYIVKHDLETLSSDLLVLANSEILDSYLKTPSSNNTKALENRFLLFVRDREVYSQARFLDLDGNEVIRVNMGEQPELVEKNKLQNKRERYYFQDTLLLEKNEIFVSPLDLNIENGQIQKPFVPVIRVGTPVFDKQNNLKGIVLINFKANNILNHYFNAYLPEDRGNFSIVNKDSFWLKSNNPDLEWGFMFDKNTSLQKEDSLLWEKIKQIQNGQVRLSTGLYTFKTIRHANIIRAGTLAKATSKNTTLSVNGEKDYSWYFILHIPEDDLSYVYYLRQHSHLFWIFPFLLFTLVSAALYMAIVRARKINFDGSLHLLSTSIEQSPAAIVITDTDGQINYANPKFEKMSGYNRGEVLGENPKIFKSGKTSNSTYDALWKTVLQGKVWKGDFENKHKNGSAYYVEAQIAPLFGSKHEIKNLLAIQEDVTEKKLLQEELEKLATTDGLTGLLNRTQFLTLCSQEIKRAIRYEKNLTLLSFDIDFFKVVNDSYGHHAGDEVLASFAHLLSTELRDSDIIGRVGGEEFCALLTETKGQGGNQLAERLRSLVEIMEVKVGDEIIKITVSIGGTTWQPVDSEIDEVLKRADAALYSAKNSGRNRVIFNNTEPNNSI